MDFLGQEQLDGIRLSWNILPSTKNDANKNAVPIAAMYTPLRAGTQTSTTSTPMPYQPIVCKNDVCSSILNPYCKVDFISKIWICPFCLQRNNFPHTYSDISQDNTPAE